MGKMVSSRPFDSISCQGEGGSCAFRASRVKNALLEPATQRSHEDVIERVWAGGVSRAIVPVMNLKSGYLTDVIRQIPASDLRVVSEIYLPIDHHLLMSREVIFGRDAALDGVPLRDLSVEQIDDALSRGELRLDDHHQRALMAQIANVYADAQAYKQCDRSIRNLIPKTQRRYTNCTSDAALEIHKLTASAVLRKDEAVPVEAAIASLDCADMYGLYPVKRNIQDLGDGNLTRYLVLSQKGGAEPTEILSQMMLDIDYERIRQRMSTDVLDDLFENVKFPISVLADVLEAYDPENDRNVHEFLPPAIDAEQDARRDAWTLETLHAGWLERSVGDREIKDDITGEVLFSAFQEARTNPYERVKLLREAMLVDSFMSSKALKTWFKADQSGFSDRFYKLQKAVRHTHDLIKKPSAHRLTQHLRKDYGDRLISTLLVRANGPKQSQNQLLKPFFDHDIDVRIIDALPEFGPATVSLDGEAHYGNWLILEIDGFLGDWRPSIRRNAKTGKIEGRDMRRPRNAVERALHRLQLDGAEVAVLGSFPKDGLWQANWRRNNVDPSKKKKGKKRQSDAEGGWGATIFLTLLLGALGFGAWASVAWANWTTVPF
jgi:prephenate dehydratase